MRIELKGDKEAADLVSESGPNSFKASVLAMNRALATGRTEMVRNIAADTGLKASDIRDKLPITRATYGKPEAQFAAGVHRIALSKFKARQTRKGVTYAFGNSGRRTIASAFIATVKAGSKVNPLPDAEASFHVGVFMRRGKTRLHIDEKAGPSLGHVFAKYRPGVTARIAEAFDTAYEHEAQRLSGGGKVSISE